VKRHARSRRQPASKFLKLVALRAGFVLGGRFAPRQTVECAARLFATPHCSSRSRARAVGTHSEMRRYEITAGGHTIATYVWGDPTREPYALLVSEMLSFTGLLLFLLGLLVGFGIPAFASPRLGVSAHATGMQSGTALLVLGLLWPHLQFRAGWSVATAYGLWISLYMIFVGMTLGAVWATGRSLPLAGGGRPAQPWQEHCVRALLAMGSLGTTAAVLAMLVQWHWTGSAPI